MEEKIKYKVAFIGASHTGKTSIVFRCSKDTFDEDNVPTIGAAFISKDFVLDDNRSITLNIWDTAGQELYRSLVPKYLQGAAAIVVVFDITEPDTFEVAKEWIRDERGNHDNDVIWYLVANKCDLDPENELTEASEYAKQNNILFIRTSAKTGQNIDVLFDTIAHKIPTNRSKVTSELDIRGDGKRNGKDCC
ncbi:ras-domain-containing protein [Histomonas meleagridis]|uniref:ras-domain-containing protein n=1 Tax=Histomonas meleagridis TaxID=135588 RepID=UPI00355AA0C8|nr:ras-domain-containing protein [Histomonas meleagridis]KAH0803459.1 ras-domain-containing protein [Histomonas meleagridis]